MFTEKMILNAIKHFKLISKHKYYVFKNCWKAGLIWRGIKHDLSKYSPTEFLESVRYFSGDRSPIDNCKEINGWSRAWMHHKGRNTHHFEYYIDNINGEQIAIQMPFKDAAELICDYLGAGQAYMKKNFSYEKEYNWWQKKKKNLGLIHNQTKIFIDIVFEELKENSDKNNKILKNLYKYYAQAETLAKSCQSSN